MFGDPREESASQIIQVVDQCQFLQGLRNWGPHFLAGCEWGLLTVHRSCLHSYSCGHLLLEALNSTLSLPCAYNPCDFYCQPEKFSEFKGPCAYGFFFFFFFILFITIVKVMLKMCFRFFFLLRSSLAEYTKLSFCYNKINSYRI